MQKCPPNYLSPRTFLLKLGYSVFSVNFLKNLTNCLVKQSTHDFTAKIWT